MIRVEVFHEIFVIRKDVAQALEPLKDLVLGVAPLCHRAHPLRDQLAHRVEHVLPRHRHFDLGVLGKTLHLLDDALDHLARENGTHRHLKSGIDRAGKSRAHLLLQIMRCLFDRMLIGANK